MPVRLASYVVPVSYRAVLAHWLALCSILGIAFTIPLVVALVARAWTLALVFLAIVAVTAGLGLLRGRFRGESLEIREAMVLTALSYLTFSVLGALPYLTVVGPLDALFEAMSSFTTTGLSTVDVQRLPMPLLFFRSYGQWIGGAGIIILSLALVFGTGKVSRELYESEFGAEDLAGSVRATARIVIRIYLALTALAIVVLGLAGLPPLEAVIHALSTVSTGGFSSHAASIEAYASPWARLAFVPVMILGATSLPLFHRLLRTGWRAVASDLQLRALLLLIAGGTLLVYAGNVLGDGHAGSHAAALTDALFHVTSGVSTTGYAVSNPAAWSGVTLFVVTLLMVIGGAGGSTAGGLKLRRFVLLLASARMLLTRASLPREARAPLRYGDETISAREESLLLAFASLYLLVLVLSTLLLVAGGFAPWPALFESASALGTVGLSVGITGPDLAPWLKAVLIFDMWAGRVEIVPVLLVLQVRTWRTWHAGRRTEKNGGDAV